MTSAWDITFAVRPPRAVFLNFPLNHQTGKAGDSALQRTILLEAFRAFETLWLPGQIVSLPYVWDPNDHGWEDRDFGPGFEPYGVGASLQPGFTERRLEPRTEHARGTSSRLSGRDDRPVERPITARGLKGFALTRPAIEVCRQQRCRPLKRVCRFTVPPNQVRGETEIPPSVGIVWPHADRLAIRLHRFRVTPEPVQGEAHVVVRVRVHGGQFDGLSELAESRAWSTAHDQSHAQIVVCVGVVRRQPNRVLVGEARLLPPLEPTE